MELLMMLFISIAVSLDGLGAGFAYGLNGIKMNKTSRFLIAAASAFAIYISLLLGVVLASVLKPEYAEKLGGLLLCGMGIYIFIQQLKTLLAKNEMLCDNNSKTFIQKVFRLLKQPSIADLDNSGNISGLEVVFVGFALAMDAFGAGFGAALAGYNPIQTSIFVGVFKFILLSLGIAMGRKLKKMPYQGIVVLLPGIIFFGIGLINIL